MSPTNIPFGSSLAATRWSGTLFLDIRNKSYWEKKFITEGDNSPIQRLPDLENEAGDTINFDLSLQLRNAPVYGDNRLEGREESLRFASDSIKIDQMRHAVSAGGKMSRKRTVHKIRQIGKARLSDYWAKFDDEMMFIYMSGARGINEDYIESLAWAGHAQNPIQAPDAAHQMYGGTATSKIGLTAADKMSRMVIEKAAVKAKMMRASDPTTVNIQPVMINGEEHYVTVMNPVQEYDMRTDAGGQGWLDIQKAAASAEGRNNPIFKGGLGMIGNVVLHSHDRVIRFSDYGAGANLPAARALFLGAQAGVVAYGSTGGLRYTWAEEIADFGNEPKIEAGKINGVKRTRFNGKDYGSMAIDTHSKDPNL